MIWVLNQSRVTCICCPGHSSSVIFPALSSCCRPIQSSCIQTQLEYRYATKHTKNQQLRWSLLQAGRPRNDQQDACVDICQLRDCCCKAEADKLAYKVILASMAVMYVYMAVCIMDLT